MDLGEVGTLLLQTLQDKVDSLEPQGDWCKHFTLIWVCENTLLNAILGQVGVKVDFGLMDKFEVGTDDNSYNVAIALIKIHKGGGVAPAG